MSRLRVLGNASGCINMAAQERIANKDVYGITRLCLVAADIVFVLDFLLCLEDKQLLPR